MQDIKWTNPNSSWTNSIELVNYGLYIYINIGLIQQYCWANPKYQCRINPNSLFHVRYYSNLILISVVISV